MARPTKQGIEYFPLDVDLDSDDKLSMIIGEFGIKGELIYTKLLGWIYKHNGYYSNWDEMEQLKFAKRVAYIGNPSVSLINEIVARCIKWGLFDQSVFVSLQILTSRRIQMTWLDATRKRKERQIDQKIWISEVNAGLRAEETSKKPEEINKVKESKVKKSNSKSHSGANAPGKVDKTLYWSKLVDTWFTFYKEKFTLEPTFNPAAGANYKKIIERIEKAAFQANKKWTEEFAVSCLRDFFTKAYSDPWIRDNFLLPVLYQKFDSIVKKVPNASNIQTPSASANHRQTGASKLADSLAASLQSATAGGTETTFYEVQPATH